MVPYSRVLSVPRTLDIANAIGAEWLSQGDAAKRRVERTTLCARTVSNVLDAFQAGTLVVTPGDRADVLVAAALSTMNGMQLAGILLTKPSTSPSCTIIVPITTGSDSCASAIGSVSLPLRRSTIGAT